MTVSAGSASFPAIAMLMVVAGMGIPLMATLNAGLGRALASPVAASTMLFGLAFVLAAATLAVVGAPPRARFAAAPPYLYAGAAFVFFYILAITWSAPRIGIGNAVFFVLLGQLIAAAAIDHFGLFGALRTSMSVRRLAGIAVMAFGVYLAGKPR